MATRVSAYAMIAAMALPCMAAPSSAAPPRVLGFHSARLGMSLQEWRTATPQPGVGPDAVPICSNEDRAVAIPGYPLSAREVRTGVVACGYKARFGHDVLTHSIEIDPDFTAQSVAYVFRRGRLDQIRFIASTDAYADIRKAFGLKPWSTGSGGIRRTRTWRKVGGEVRIGPGPNPSLLTVDLLRR